MSSGGAICSAVFKKNVLYAFFDSHSHGPNGLSSSEGTSIMIFFSCLDDLVTYLYAFYDSMKIDMSLQFDFLPVNVRKSNEEKSSKGQLESYLEAYFKDQKLRQVRKAQSKLGCIDVPIETSGAKKKKRTSRPKYYKKVKRNQRDKEGALAKECAKIKLEKQKPTFKASEKEQQRVSKQEARKNPAFKASKKKNNSMLISRKQERTPP